MTAFRVVATDLDGTIIPHGGTVSGQTLEAFRRLDSLGIPVVFATGRPPRWLTPVLEVTGHTGLVVSANGALTMDVGKDSIVDIQPLAPALISRVAELLRARVPDVALGVETPTEIRVEDHYSQVRGQVRSEGMVPTASGRGKAITAERVEDLVDDDPFIKMLAVSAVLSPDELLAAGREQLGDEVSLTHSSKGQALLEISAAGVSKAAALERLTAQWQVSADQVIAFGDMPNDVDMLAWAGAGYVMADGHPEALRVADHVAPPATEDGVARVLSEVFGLGLYQAELDAVAPRVIEA